MHYTNIQTHALFTVFVGGYVGVGVCVGVFLYNNIFNLLLNCVINRLWAFIKILTGAVET